ncbi:MAG TPA: ubiquinone/menaquinone biosynthesis methyltransferase, partial [Tepidisphaeraceae bacterium]
MTTWDDKLLASPHTVADKRSRVQKMFAAIAPSYDINNRLHSLWMDQQWRKKAVKLAELKPSDQVVDVACGTGDLTLRFVDGIERLCYREEDRQPQRGQIIGIDFTFEMLPIARRKPQFESGRGPVGWDGKAGPVARFINGDAQALPLADQSADVVSIAFGIRNVQDPLAAVKEFHRVLRPGGRMIILEFSLPTNPALRGCYNFYFRKILPRTATLISGDKT